MLKIEYQSAMRFLFQVFVRTVMFLMVEFPKGISTILSKTKYIINSLKWNMLKAQMCSNHIISIGIVEGPWEVIKQLSYKAAFGKLRRFKECKVHWWIVNACYNMLTYVINCLINWVGEPLRQFKKTSKWITTYFTNTPQHTLQKCTRFCCIASAINHIAG